MKQLLCIFLVSLLVSCSTRNQVKEIQNNTILQKWELSLLAGKKIKENRPIFIEFTTDNIVIGFLGCNQLTGKYFIEKGDKIKFNYLGLTRLACRDKEMEMEGRVLKLLKTADNFSIEKGALILKNASTPLATFTPIIEKEIVNKHWKLKILGGDTVKMIPNQEKEQYFILNSDGNISGFAGCNHFNGKYELKKENRISINENLGFTKKLCPDVEIDEGAFLKILLLADNYTIKGDLLFLNVRKKSPLAVFEAVYF